MDEHIATRAARACTWAEARVVRVGDHYNVQIAHVTINLCYQIWCEARQRERLALRNRGASRGHVVRGIDKLP